jgi:hypothetical protein
VPKKKSEKECIPVVPSLIPANKDNAFSANGAFEQGQESGDEI